MLAPALEVQPSRWLWLAGSFGVPVWQRFEPTEKYGSALWIRAYTVR